MVAFLLVAFAGTWQLNAQETKVSWSLDCARPVVSIAAAAKCRLLVLLIRNEPGVDPAGNERHFELESQVLFWELETRKVVGKLQFESLVWSIAVSPNEKMVAIADGGISLWNPLSRRMSKSLETDSAIVLAFSSDSRILASGHSDGAVRLWDVATGKIIAKLAAHDRLVSHLAFSSNGMLATCSWDGTVCLWDVTRLKRMRVLKADSPQTLAFSPDGKSIASGGKELQLWDVASGRKRASLRGHTKKVRSISWSLDGKTIASASWDQSIRIWHVETNRILTTLLNHGAEVHSVMFTPIDRVFVSGGQDKTMKVWCLPEN